MSEVARCLGDEAQIEYQGQVYKLVPWDRFGVQKEFTAWLKLQAVLALRELRPLLTPQEHAEHLSRLQQDVTAGVYDWGGEAWERAIGTEKGYVQIVLLDLRVSHPDVTEKTARGLIEEHGEELNAVLRWLVTDPNSRPPRETAA
jgi:hypothetical protein